MVSNKNELEAFVLVDALTCNVSSPLVHLKFNVSLSSCCSSSLNSGLFFHVPDCLEPDSQEINLYGLAIQKDTSALFR